MFKDLIDTALGIMTTTMGEVVYYQHKNLKGTPYKIDAVFDESWTFVDPDTMAEVSSNEPRLGIRLRDLKIEPVKDDKVIVGRRHFLVKDSLEDGQGGSYLPLHLDFEE